MKPLLLGMNNPLSDDPEFDLYPYPEGSAGYRLWKLLPEGTARAQYLAAFDRRNLLRARQWSAAEARVAAQALLPELAGRLVVVLGSDVRAALGLSKVAPLSLNESWLHPSPDFSMMLRWVALPHPSGRNLWYNNKANRLRASDLLERIMRGAVS